jgi:hypothetical protein
MAWRPRPELNRGKRFCRPLRNHSATWPSEAIFLKLPSILGNPRFVLIVSIPKLFRCPIPKLFARSFSRDVLATFLGRDSARSSVRLAYPS